MFYLDKFFFSCRLINKNVLEWFLLIILWTDLQTFSVETIPHCVFDLEEKVGRCPILNSKFMKLKKAATRFSKKILFSNTSVEFLRTTILKNICVQLLLNWFYEVIVWKFVSGSYLKSSWLNNITKYQSLSNQSFKQFLAQMPSMS